MTQPVTMTDRDAHFARARLVEALERLRPFETASEPNLLADLPAVPNRDTLRQLLASIGAVRVGDGWCFGDGPPPGWAWWPWSVDGRACYVLARAWENQINDRYIAEIAPGDGWIVRRPSAESALIEALLSSKVGLADGQRTAIRVCRLWGLFS